VTAMLLTALAVVLVILPGALAGALVAEVIVHRALRQPDEAAAGGEAPIDASVDDFIDSAAASWARTNDWPEGEGLIANKMRLAYRLRRSHRAADPVDRGWWQ